MYRKNPRLYTWSSLAILLLLAACQPLERQGVPLWAAVVATQQVPHSLRVQDAQRQRLAGMAGCVLIVPLQRSKHGWALPDSNWREVLAWQAVLQAAGVQVGVHYKPTPLKMPPNQAHTTWIQIRDSLHQPMLTLVDADLVHDSASLAWAWAHHPTLCYPDHALPPGPPAARVGVAVQHAPDGNYKRWARTRNTRIDSLARRLGASVCIAEANLMGVDKTVQFENLLRFYSEDTRLDAVVLNTLYPLSVFSDSVSYFGLAHDAQFQRSLRAYTQ